MIIEIYRNRSRRYRLKRFQLKKISGRSVLKSAFIEKLAQYLLDQGYFMLESSEGEQDFFIIIRIRQVHYHVKSYLKTSEISHYFKTMASEIDEEYYEEE